MVVHNLKNLNLIKVHKKSYKERDKEGEEIIVVDDNFSILNFIFILFIILTLN